MWIDDAPQGKHIHSLILVRHGRTAYNAAHRLQGQVDIPLDEVGLWQVEQTAQALKELYVDAPRQRHIKQLIVASDLGRAVTTAHAFADAIGAPVHVDERARERNFGQWEGLSAEELEASYPEDYRRWLQYDGGELAHGAESREQVASRGVAAIRDWAAQADADTDLYVFAHGSWITQVTLALLHLPMRYPEVTTIVSMNNAHWARLVPLAGQLQASSTLQAAVSSASRAAMAQTASVVAPSIAGANIAEPQRWRLVDYNRAPQIADTAAWETGVSA